MKNVANIVGLVIGVTVLGAVSFFVSGWEDPFLRPMDLLKSAFPGRASVVRIAYPDEITIDRDFANALLKYKEGITSNPKVERFLEHLEGTEEYVITPKNSDTFRAIVVRNEGKGVLSFSIYIGAIVDSRSTEVLYRLSGFIKQFPSGPQFVERAEKVSMQKMDIPLDFYYKNDVNLWDLAIYGALEAGPCCN